MKKSINTVFISLFKTPKQIEINIKVVPSFPLFVTFTVFSALSTYKPPKETNNSRIINIIRNIGSKNEVNHKTRRTKTIRSVMGSRIIPSLDTWFNFLATMPSTESLIPINAINNTKLVFINSSAEVEVNM